MTGEAISSLSPFEKLKFKNKNPQVRFYQGNNIKFDQLVHTHIVCYPSFEKLVQEMKPADDSRTSVFIDEAHHFATWASEGFQGVAINAITKILSTRKFKSVTALSATPVSEMFWNPVFKNFKIIRVHEEVPRLDQTSYFWYNNTGLSYEEGTFFFVDHKFKNGNDIGIVQISQKYVDRIHALCEQEGIDHYHTGSSTITDEELQGVLFKLLSRKKKKLPITHTAVLETGVNLTTGDSSKVFFATTAPFMNGPVNACQSMGRVRNGKSVDIIIIFDGSREKDPDHTTPEEYLEIHRYFMKKREQDRESIIRDLLEEFEDLASKGKSYRIPKMIEPAEIFYNISFVDGKLVHTNADDVYNSYKMRLFSLARSPEDYLREMELYGVKNGGEYIFTPNDKEMKKVLQRAKGKAEKAKKEREKAALEYVTKIVEAETPEEKKALLEEKPQLKNSYAALEKVASYSFPTQEEGESWVNHILIQTKGNTNRIKKEIERMKIRMNPEYQRIVENPTSLNQTGIN